MRLRCILGMSTIAMLAILIGTDGYGQQGGPGGRGRMTIGQMDPNQRFDQIAQGNEYFLLSDVRGFMNTMLTAYAKEKNITFPNGQVTRQDFLAFSDWQKEKFSFRISIQGAGTQPAGKNKPGAPSTSAGVDTLRQMADLDFKTRDQNNDGKLNQDEMPGRLGRDLARWDKNKDGLIDQAEYRDYYVDLQQQRLIRANSGSPGVQPNVVDATLDDELDKRPVVLRAGKLPTKGMPPWFVQLDADADGQVALYEWRTAGRDLEEFKEWDRDNDGFITPEEAIHAYAALTKTPDPLLASNVDAQNASPGMPQFNMFNRGPGGGFGGNPWGGGFGGNPWGGFGGGKGGPWGGGKGGLRGGGFGGGKGRGPGGFNPGGFNPADRGGFGGKGRNNWGR